LGKRCLFKQIKKKRCNFLLIKKYDSEDDNEEEKREAPIFRFEKIICDIQLEKIGLKKVVSSNIFLYVITSNSTLMIINSERHVVRGKFLN
jgi:hypothetical protein